MIAANEPTEVAIDSRSEIVVPVFNQQGEVAAVLDIDSTDLATFDYTDQCYLEQMCQKLSNLFL